MNGTATDFEPKYLIDRGKAIGSISAVLSTKSKEGGEFTKVLNSRKDNVYSIRKNTQATTGAW